MTALYAPTDSILRRHFNQIAANAGLPPLPEDSVLRRHHAQLLESRLASGRAVTPQVSPRVAPVASVQPQAVVVEQVQRPSMAQVTASPAPAESKGWLGRVLDKLFG